MNDSTRPLILVTNDDGYLAKGIRSLVDTVLSLGDVVVVAPDKPQSGMGHAVTLHHVLRLNAVQYPAAVHQAFSCSGTPVDCVKLAIDQVLHRTPDLIVSGINHGSNASTNILYSGTMSAAIEGAVEGIPSIGFSLLDFDADADFTAAAHYAHSIASQVLQNGLEEGVCLNVNIPKLPLSNIHGVKVCRQGRAYWEDNFDKRTDPSGKEYYWMTGEYAIHDKGEDTDEFALAHGFVSMVPVQYDLTAYHAFQRLNNWSLK
jgi:5'-nucleotidase